MSSKPQPDIAIANTEQGHVKASEENDVWSRVTLNIIPSPPAQHETQSTLKPSLLYSFIKEQLQVLEFDSSQDGLVFQLVSLCQQNENIFHVTLRILSTKFEIWPVVEGNKEELENRIRAELTQRTGGEVNIKIYKGSLIIEITLLTLSAMTLAEATAAFGMAIADACSYVGRCVREGKFSWPSWEGVKKHTSKILRSIRDLFGLFRKP
jgi:hypothetical protein